MLELRPNCECCNRDLSSESREAVICTFECIFCADFCIDGAASPLPYLPIICPNCGSELLQRPIRPAMDAYSLQTPASTQRVYQPDSCGAGNERLSTFS